jgi:hypothetical protein
MAIRLGSAYGKVELDASGVVKGANTAKQSFGAIEAAGARMGEAMQQIGARMTLALTVPLILIGKKAIEFASGLQQSKDNVKIVFGEMSDAVLTWSQTSAKSFGQSQEDALDAVTAFDRLLESYNIGQQEAADMSMKLVALSSNLAIFNKTSASDAQGKLLSGLQGNTEALKDFGITISDAEIRAKAFQMGLMDGAVDMVKVNGAVLDLKDAQKDLADMQNGGADSADKVAKAQGRVADAADRVDDAYTRVQRAQKDLNDLMADGEATSKQIERAQRKVEDAEDNLTTALRKRTEAQIYATNAAKNSIPQDLDLAQAKQDVAEAEQRINTAMDGNLSKLDDATTAQVTYQLILEKTADIQGDFSDETDNAAVQMMIFNAEVKNAVTQLGTILLPIVLDIVIGLNDMLEKFQSLPIGIQEAIVNFGIFLGLSGPIINFIGTIKLLKFTIGGLVTSLKGLFVGGRLTGLITTMATFGTWLQMVAIPAIVAFFSTFGAIIIAIIALVLGLIFVIWAFATDFMGVTTTLKQLWSIVAIVFKQEWEKIKTAFKLGWDFIKEKSAEGWEQIKLEWTDGWEQIKAQLDAGIAGWRLALTTIWNWIVTWARGVVQSILNAFNINWSQIGTNIINGIMNGLTSMWDSLVALAQEIAQSVLDAFDGVLEMGSPSAAMDRRGFNSGLGYMRGMKRGMNPFEMMQLAAVPLQAVGGAGGGGSNVTMVNNFASGLTERQAYQIVDGRIEQAFERLSRMLESA